MLTKIAALPSRARLDSLADSLHVDGSGRRQRLYPVIDENRALLGVATRNDLQKLVDRSVAGRNPELHSIVKPDPVVAYPDEPLRLVVYRMAET